jgi:hypothetical protein
VAEHVALTVPATPDYLSLARLHVGELASRRDVDVEQLELLQLAVEELCLSLIRPRASAQSRLHLDFEWDRDSVGVRCRLSNPLPAPGAVTLEGREERAELLSRRLLDALVDEHGSSLEEDEPSAWLRHNWGASPRSA